MQSNIGESRLSLRESWFTLKPLLTEPCPWLRIKIKMQTFDISGYFSPIIINIFRNSSSLDTLNQNSWANISKDFIKLLLVFCLHPPSLLSFSWTLLTELDQTSFAKLQYELRQDWLGSGKQHFGQVCTAEDLFLGIFGRLVEAFYENIS